MRLEPEPNLDIMSRIDASKLTKQHRYERIKRHVKMVEKAIKSAAKNYQFSCEIYIEAKTPQDCLDIDFLKEYLGDRGYDVSNAPNDSFIVKW